MNRPSNRPKPRKGRKAVRWSSWSFIMHHIPPSDIDRQHLTCACGWVETAPAGDFGAILRARRRHERKPEHKAWLRVRRGR